MPACSKTVQERLATKAAQMTNDRAILEDISRLAAETGSLVIQAWLLAHTSSIMQSLAIQCSACDTQVLLAGSNWTKVWASCSRAGVQHLNLLALTHPSNVGPGKPCSF